MGTIRHAGSRFLGKGPNGRNLCYCGCGREVMPPRLNWFSKECVEAWGIKNHPEIMEKAVFKRDKGICCLCGCNCVEFRKRAWEHLKIIKKSRQYWGGEIPIEIKPDEYDQNIVVWKEQNLGPGWGKVRFDRVRWWDIDHIHPVVKGGGQCGLDNLRTLCIVCHKKETAKLRASLSKKHNKKDLLF